MPKDIFYLLTLDYRAMYSLVLIQMVSCLGSELRRYKHHIPHGQRTSHYTPHHAPAASPGEHTAA